MESTYNIKAIIINRYDFREKDAKVIAFSDEKGKVELVARGVKKIKSKLSSHIEPITLANIMVVRGKNFDYLGSIIGENYFKNIKNDLGKLEIAGSFLFLFIYNLKLGATSESEELFNLLLSFLFFLDEPGLKVDLELVKSIFIYKVLVILGYRQEIFYCISCKKKLTPKNNIFVFNSGGIACSDCKIKSKYIASVSDEVIKLLRLAGEINIKNIKNINIKKSVIDEFEEIVNKIFAYNK